MNVQISTIYLNQLRQSLFSAIQKRDDAPMSSDAHIDEVALSLANLLINLGEFTPSPQETAFIDELRQRVPHCRL